MKASSIVRARPDANSPAIYKVQENASVRIIEEQEHGPFLRVVGDRGPAGWVLSEAVEVLSPAVPMACRKNEEPGKKKPSERAVAILDFNDLLKLQSQAERLLGMGHELSPEERGKLSSLASGEPRTGELRMGEGAVARIGGFLAAKPEAPRVAGQCNGGMADDWLLSITSEANSKAFSGMIGRISASKRNPKWSLEKLKTAWTKQYPVMVTGVLFYDGAGLVNDDSANPIGGELPRAWLWELRQISSILVCTGGACEPGSSEGWISLDQLN